MYLLHSHCYADGNMSNHESEVACTYITGEIEIDEDTNTAMPAGTLLYKNNRVNDSQKQDRTNRVQVTQDCAKHNYTLVGVSPYTHIIGKRSAYDSWRCLAVSVYGPCLVNITAASNEHGGEPYDMTVGDIIGVNKQGKIQLYDQISITQRKYILGTILDVPRDKTRPHLVFVSIVPAS
jgi:hypothetical protein